MTLKQYLKVHMIALSIGAHVRREILHTLLANTGIQKIEALLTEAKKNREQEGHNNYTKLADWLSLKL